METGSCREAGLGLGWTRKGPGRRSRSGGREKNKKELVSQVCEPGGKSLLFVR